jgi:ribosomal protein S24E
MVLLRRKLPIFSQEDIGYELGLTVPKRYKKLLPKARTGKKPSAGWGTQVGKRKYPINNFFRKHKIPLKEEYFSLQKIENVKDWIREQIEKDNDILVCFNYRKLYGKGKKKQGHVCILDTILRDEVILIDPEYRVPKFRKVKLKKLLEAMKFHGEKNRAGFWLISPIKSLK